MVRVNLIDPKYLADQHLIAEYNEILMLVAYIRKYPQLCGIPDKYCLGKGHMRFFKDKLIYLKNRHELIKKEMRKRGFVTNKSISLIGLSRFLLNSYIPKESDKNIIRERIIEKINKKPNYYRYCGEYKLKSFLINLIKNSK